MPAESSLAGSWAKVGEVTIPTLVSDFRHLQELLEPLWLGHRIIVEQCDVLPTRSSAIPWLLASAKPTLSSSASTAYPGAELDPVVRAVRGSVVDNDALESCQGLSGKRQQHRLQERSAVPVEQRQPMQR